VVPKTETSKPEVVPKKAPSKKVDSKKQIEEDEEDFNDEALFD
jgi:hypothetical protein